MSMSMRERIAKRICCPSGACQNEGQPFAVCQKSSFFESADAVLTEQEKPTEGMVKAMASVFGINVADDDEATQAFLEDMGKAFTAAILAAKEGK